MHTKGIVNLGVFGLAALLGGVWIYTHVGRAAEPPTSGTAQRKTQAYGAVLKECGRNGQVHFFSALNGLWPVPSNFVLVDAANHRLEYNDRAFPWDDPPATSAVFFGPRDVIERSWPGLFARSGEAQPGECSLQVMRYRTTDEFGTSAVLVSSRYEHLLLVGPISNAASSALECYASVQRESFLCN